MPYLNRDANRRKYLASAAEARRERQPASVNEAAAVLNRHPFSVFKLVSGGKIAAHKSTAGYLIEWDDIEAHMGPQLEAPTAASVEAETATA